MIRRQAKFSLSGSRESVAEEVNPLENIPNLVDIMLVFSVALMMSLISFWNLDFPSASTVESERLKQVEADLTQGESQEVLAGDSYQEVGTVYKNTETGELYLLEE